MHHFIARQYIEKIPEGKIIDHVNKNKLDNRRENLRLATIQINSENRTLNKNKKTSKYRGVFYNKQQKKYQVTTNIGGKRVNMGCYKTEKEAAEVMDMYLVHNEYDHVDLNFPNKYDEYLGREYKPYNKYKTSKYLGVRRHKHRKNFSARIRHNGKYITILTHSDQLVCAKAYDKYIVDNNIPGKKLNFSGTYPEYEPNTNIKTECEKTKDKNIVRLIIKSQPTLKVFIDKEDYDKVKYYAWCITDECVSANVNGTTTRLHHFVINVNGTGITVDHIDSNILNNCKNNLRISDSEKNSQNKSKSTNKSSEYFGVSFNKSRNNWLVTINYNRKHIFIGLYKSEISAARAHDLFIIIHLPDEHYKLNFKWMPKDINIWKKKLYSSKSPNKWIAKTSRQKIVDNVNRLYDTADTSKWLLLEKLHASYNNKMHDNIDAETKTLGII